jgi:hypothetical protein
VAVFLVCVLFVLSTVRNWERPQAMHTILLKIMWSGE